MTRSDCEKPQAAGQLYQESKKRSKAAYCLNEEAKITQDSTDWQTVALLYEEIAELSQGEKFKNENFKHAGFCWKQAAYRTAELEHFKNSSKNYQASGDINNVLRVWEEANSFYQSYQDPTNQNYCIARIIECAKDLARQTPPKSKMSESRLPLLNQNKRKLEKQQELKENLKIHVVFRNGR